MAKNNYTLGIHLGHDRGATLIKDGVIDAHIAQDRVDRIKHSDFPLIPFEAIDKILEYRRVKIREIGAIGISFLNSKIEKLLPIIQDEICSYYRLNSVCVFGVSHHLAHAYASIYTSGFTNSLVLVCDGAGDLESGMLESESLYFATPERVELVEKRVQSCSKMFEYPQHYKYPVMSEKIKNWEVSLGLKYEQFTFNLGFKLNQDGKTMGLSSYGQSLLKFDHYQYDTLNFSIKAGDILQELDEMRKKRGLKYTEFFTDQKENIAATVQSFLENALLKITSSIATKYQHPHLCLAGGVFLNCVANHKILQSRSFEEVHFLPSSGDDGQSVGAGFFAYKKIFKNLKSSSANLPYLGISYSDQEIENTLNKAKLNYSKMMDLELIVFLSRSLAQGQIIGMLRGRSEIGPRALGHRSILADPRSAKIKDTLNHKVKMREGFRPYAPMVVKEEQFDIFELEKSSPYMLLAANVRKAYRPFLKGITHCDNTARVQSISKDSEPFLHALLLEFKSISGVPVLLNTSFNLAGEPMIESPNDAISAFFRMKIDILILENYVINRKGQVLHL